MPGTILVVDDEKNIVQLARLYLNNEGFRVESAHDGKQALEKAKSLKPDLIVLDIMMPEMDGLTVCKEIRKTSNVPVIILTARGEDIDRIVGLEIGADDYMAKPFNPRELVARVKAVLRRAQGERDTPDVIEVEGLRIDAGSREVTLDGRSLQLRAKEFELLSLLADRCVEVLGVAAAGVMLVAPEGDLRVVASSSEPMRVVELFELQAEEGPCLDCFASGEAVLNQDLTTVDGRWPRFGPVAVEAGFHAAHALPMKLRGSVIGALNLFAATRACCATRASKPGRLWRPSRPSPSSSSAWSPTPSSSPPSSTRP